MLRPASREAYQLLHDGAIALSQVETNGIKIDDNYLSNAMESTANDIKSLEAKLRDDRLYSKWRRLYGHKMNLGSGEQLAELLFRHEGFTPRKWTEKTAHLEDESKRKPSSDADHLLSTGLEFAECFVQLEKRRKALGTFLKGIRRETVDGYLHPVFNLHIARTYRSSSDSPNFQNFPIRDKFFAELIRRCFVPRDENHVLVEIDYGGIEVCGAACYNKDPNLIQEILDPDRDMHRDMAAACYKLPPSRVTKMIRYCGKNKFVFPQFYGSYYVDCAQSLWNAIDELELKTDDGIPLKEHLKSKGINRLGNCDPQKSPKLGTFEHHVAKVEKQFWTKRFPVYSKWKRDWVNQYQSRGWARTHTGFVLQGVYRRNEIINYPIQGSAFHCLLWSLIRLQRAMTKRKMDSKVVGQIHDSIIADVHVDELDDYLQMAKVVMTENIRKYWDWIIIPLTVEAEITPPGCSWFEKKEVPIP
jgi:DNA polymerase-1